MNEQVFISHSSKDRAWADRFLEFFEKDGIRCWIDKQGIRTGAKYYRAIDAAIKQ